MIRHLKSASRRLLSASGTSLEENVGSTIGRIRLRTTVQLVRWKHHRCYGSTPGGCTRVRVGIGAGAGAGAGAGLSVGSALESKSILLLSDLQPPGTHQHRQYSYDSLKDYSSFKNERTILLVGDGDLSNGASMSSGLKRTRPNCHLIASVLESEEQHNEEIIRNNGHEVRFEVDATRLSDHFPSTIIANTNADAINSENRSCDQDRDEACSIPTPASAPASPDRIQFNFPHWRGKTNNRRNRALISAFLASSQQILPIGGQMHLALLNHQGGMHSSTNQEWKCSWLPSLYAADHGMLLSQLEPFRPDYNLSSYQFRDRPFHVLDEGRDPYMHIYDKVVGDCDSGLSDGDVEMCARSAPKEIQMCSYFTLFVSFPDPVGGQWTDDDDDGDDGNDDENLEDHGSKESTDISSHLWTNEEIFDESAMHEMIQSKTPPGIRTNVKLWRILRGKSESTGALRDTWNVAEYKVYFLGERQPITFADAETYKNAIENEVQKFTRGTRRGGWTSSNIIPSSVLRARGWSF